MAELQNTMRTQSFSALLRPSDMWVSGVKRIEPLPDGLYRLVLYRNHLLQDRQLVEEPTEWDLVMSNQAIVDAISKFGQQIHDTALEWNGEMLHLLR